MNEYDGSKDDIMLYHCYYIIKLYFRGSYFLKILNEDFVLSEFETTMSYKDTIAQIVNEVGADVDG